MTLSISPRHADETLGPNAGIADGQTDDARHANVELVLGKLDSLQNFGRPCKYHHLWSFSDSHNSRKKSKQKHSENWPGSKITYDFLVITTDAVEHPSDSRFHRPTSAEAQKHPRPVWIRILQVKWYKINQLDLAISRQMRWDWIDIEKEIEKSMEAAAREIEIEMEMDDMVSQTVRQIDRSDRCIDRSGMVNHFQISRI